MSGERPSFLREGTWRLMNEPEQAGLLALVAEVDAANARATEAHASVEKYRGLSRKLAEQAKVLLEQVRRTEAQGTPPSVVGRMERLADDLEATARGAERREAIAPGELSYTPPFPKDDDDDELRVPTLVSAVRKR